MLAALAGSLAVGAVVHSVWVVSKPGLCPAQVHFAAKTVLRYIIACRCEVYPLLSAVPVREAISSLVLAVLNGCSYVHRYPVLLA